MKPAVLVIDMQEAFLRKHFEEARELIVASQLEVLSYCAETDVPVIVVEYETYGSTIDVLLEKLKSVPRHKKVTKCQDSAFHYKSEPYPSKLLKELSIDYLVLMGVNAACCVEQTALDALQQGYKICTSAELIADKKSFLKHKKIKGLLETTLSYFGVHSDPNTNENSEQYKFLTSDSVAFYRQSGDFFNTHQDLIAHLDASRNIAEVL